MEPLESAKNEESSGFSKRRISSILKVPRKSAKFPDPDQQEYTVECVKPVEKRGSRRVSFAPANDVLLFSNDVKKASPGRSPLQELLTATETTKNRVHVAAAEDGIQQIMGMETLLKAPLHASHQRDRVNLGIGQDFGEKTMMFSTDDAFMDMTHSHTINIANDAEFPADIHLQEYGVLPNSGERTTTSTAENKSMDMTLGHTVRITSGSESLPSGRNIDLSVEKKNRSSSLACLDPEFENFLASLSKSGGPLVNPVITKISPVGTSSEVKNCSLAQNKTEMNDVDKENQIPTSASFALDKSRTSRKIGESSYGRALCPEDNMSMDITEAQTGRIQGSDDDDFFRCLFPSQEMYSQSDKRVSQTSEMTSKQQQSSSVLSSPDPKDTASLRNHFLHASHQNHKINFEEIDQCREKTVFAADDDFMDMTQSHTANIASGLLAPQQIAADGLDLGFKQFLASQSKSSGLSANPAITRVTPSAKALSAQDCEIVRRAQMTSGQKNRKTLSSYEGMETTLKTSLKTDKLQRHQVKFDTDDNCGEKTVRFTANDAAMDVTQSHTVNIATTFEPQSCHNLDFIPTCEEKTVRFASDDAAMDVTQSHTVNIATAFEPKLCHNLDLLPINGDKTMRFAANEACMDVTRSHTVNIAANLELTSQQNSDFLPTCGEKTVRFTASDAAMDVTQSHTVSIAAAFEPQSCQNAKLLHTSGEKTLRFSANDACMDVTRSHTVNIATNLKLGSHQNGDSLSTSGEKTVRFTASDAAMDITQSQTVSIAAAFEPQLCQNADLIPSSREKTITFTSTDSAMDVTQSHTVNISSNSGLDSVHPHQGSDIISTHSNMDLPLTVKKTKGGLHKNAFSSAYSLDPGFNNVLPRTSGLLVNPVITKAVAPAAPSPQESLDTNGYLDYCVNTESEATGTMEKPENGAKTDCIEDNVGIDLTEVKRSSILAQTCTDDLSQRVTSKQDLYPESNYLKKTEAPFQPSSEGPVSSDGFEILHHPDSLDANKTETRKETQISNEISPVSQATSSSPSAIERDTDTLCSQKSRRKSLANLQSKIRRLSHMINTSPEDVVMSSHTVPLPQLNYDLDKNQTDKTRCLPVGEPGLEIGLLNAEDGTQAHCLKEEEERASITATPFNLKTKQLMSRLSVGGFKPKLPQRSKPDGPKKMNSMREHTKTITVNVTSQLSSFDNDVSDIYDEELGSCEDVSETLDTRSPQKSCDKLSCSQEFDTDEPLDEYLFEEDFISGVQGQKRPLGQDEINTEDEKRVKTSTEMTTDTADAIHREMEFLSHGLECDGNVTTAPTMTTQTTDFSNSTHTASRCEATFESTFKHSMFESQLEEYASDVQKKFDDGTVTVSEFFKLFNIDFVIHNPRQSVLPGRLSSDTDRTPMDLLKDRHINRPKQMVYETDVLNLTEKVEGLKVRMRDLEKPLKFVNRPLWEEMRNLSEKELKSFGAKLKERNNFFRKTSKTDSHEMKEVLYSNLVQANLRDQQALKETIEKADEMIKSLDDCIHELETELASVEENGLDGKPSLKSRQEELKKVTEALAHNERQVSELEIQKKQSSHHLSRLKTETRNLENHITVLHTVNEWKLGKKADNRMVYTFLYDTMNVKVVYEKSSGKNADNGPEKKISDITFKFSLNDETAGYNARFVHKLLSQYIEEESAWVKKYPTSRHVPKLLHDVGLVVSRCRLLGEELRLLKMWGSLRLDILDISSVDTQVHIVFSSLKKFAKFEVVLSVSLINELYVLQLHSFKNKIGNTTIQQIEEIVASFSPGRKLLTKVVKKIHENLLR
ncbi:kinetochore scaffold 1 isoform X2 [Anabas testudineus]|uniref:kinetochore scaffold 1 isoform X2 n=1 Tax=Anabas testudineus TaxID=64144 RepID=UPI000E462496|nr:kinetochore scaffold 1 isoform X2 [Anabas testudineus]